jgi:hypothetical protein
MVRMTRRLAAVGRGRRLAAAAVVVAAVFAASTEVARSVPGVVILGNSTPTYLYRCSRLHSESSRWNCYVQRLLREVERSGDPANQLPRIDRKVHGVGGYLEGSCHMMMHVVGRMYVRRHHVTLETLRRYLPRSNDPGCSAGFGMGLVIAVAPQLGRLGPDGAVKMCLRAPTRFRSYTCIHTLGHAYMRLFHEQLAPAVEACRALPQQQAPDCAQGVYHDYWFSLSGRDGTKRQRNGPTTARSLCRSQLPAFVRPCWYRYFVERPPNRLPETPRAIRGLCVGLVGLQRTGCIGAASLIASPDPFVQLRLCARLPGPDAASCLYGVNVQNVARRPLADKVALIRQCAGVGRRAQHACYEWIGRTLTVVTDGRFRSSGCERLRYLATRSTCADGGRHMGDPLVTFS